MPPRGSNRKLTKNSTEKSDLEYKRKLKEKKKEKKGAAAENKESFEAEVERSLFHVVDSEGQERKFEEVESSDEQEENVEDVFEDADEL